MADLTDVFKTASFLWGTRTLVLPRPNFGVEAAYCQFCKKKALADIQAMRRELGEGGYKEALAAWQRDCGMGNYSWTSSYVQMSLNNTEWLKELIFQCLQSVGEQRDITREMVETMWADCQEMQTDAEGNPKIVHHIIEAYMEVTTPNPTKPPLPAA